MKACKMLPVYISSDLYNEALLLVARLVKTRKQKSIKISGNKKKAAQVEKMHKVKTSTIGCQTERDGAVPSNVSTPKAPKPKSVKTSSTGCQVDCDSPKLKMQTEKSESLQIRVDSLEKELAEAKAKLADVSTSLVSTENELADSQQRESQMSSECDNLEKKIIRGKATLEAETRRADQAEQRERNLTLQLKDAQKMTKDLIEPATVINNVITHNTDRRVYEHHQRMSINVGDGSERRDHEPPSARQGAVEDVVRGGAIEYTIDKSGTRFFKKLLEHDRVSKWLSKTISKKQFVTQCRELVREQNSPNCTLSSVALGLLYDIKPDSVTDAELERLVYKYEKYL